MADAHSSLVLPAPPPPPTGAPGLSRSPAAASDDSARTLRPAVFAGAEKNDELKEVTVDDLTREISDLSSLVSTLSGDFSALLAARDAVIASGPLSTPAQLSALAGQTTRLGGALLALAPSLSTTSQRLQRLAALTAQGLTAALPAELAPLEESLATTRLDASRLTERVRRAAWEEVDARESARRRLEERVRAENAALGEEGVEMAVRTAFVGAQRPVAELDVLSYAGRVALENPATELAQLIDEAGDAHEAALSGSSLARESSRYSTATTLVDPFADPAEDGDGYGKPEGEHDLADGDGESQPLARMATSSTRHGGRDEEALVGGGGGGGAEGVQGKKLVRMTMLKLHWRDYLVRLGLLIFTVGLVVGVVVYESVAQQRENDEALSSAPSALPAATSS